MKAVMEAIIAFLLLIAVDSLYFADEAGAAQSPTEIILYTFNGNSDGRSPRGNLVMDAGGNLFGATYAGGDPSDVGKRPFFGNGVIYKLSPPRAGSTTWTQSVLYRFQAASDGASPSNLVIDTEGNIFGTASSSPPGQGNICFRPTQHDCGLVFELHRPSGAGAWILTIVHHFTGGDDGDRPIGLAMNAQGDIFGVTQGGGTGSCGNLGCGTIFELSRSASDTSVWQKKTLYRFQGGNDGAEPVTSPFVDSKGNLWGTTFAGGGPGCINDWGCGVVYRLTSPAPASDTWNEAVLFKAGGPVEYLDFGRFGLVVDRSGDVYGLADLISDSGCRGPGCSSVFKLRSPQGTNDSQWTKSVWYSFPSGTPCEGGQLTIDSIGNLFGTSCGDHSEVFELSTAANSDHDDGRIVILHDFWANYEGNPNGNLLLDRNGNIFGTIKDGGDSEAGSVFEIKR